MCKSNTLYSLIFFFLTIYLIFSLYCYYIYIYCKAGERECVIYSNALYSFIFFCPSIYLFISLFIAIKNKEKHYIQSNPSKGLAKRERDNVLLLYISFFLFFSFFLLKSYMSFFLFSFFLSTYPYICLYQLLVLLEESKNTESTVCPGSSDPFYIVSYYIKWVTTFRTHSISNPNSEKEGVFSQEFDTPSFDISLSFNYFLKNISTLMSNF